MRSILSMKMRGGHSPIISMGYVQWTTLVPQTALKFWLMMRQVLGGDKDIGHLLPIPTDSMQLFDECKGTRAAAFSAYSVYTNDLLYRWSNSQ
jgi:hypothetical protein